MKSAWIITIAAAVGLVSCGEKKTTTGEIKDKVGDALNTRPHEGARDAAEDIEKDLKKAGKEADDELKELGNDIKKEINDATK